MGGVRTALRLLFKPFRDLASVLYDDLEFKAMSLPRVAAALLTGLIAWVVAVWVRADRMFPGFDTLCALTGGIWGAYLFKRRQNPPEHGKCEGGELTNDSNGETENMGGGGEGQSPDGNADGG